MSIQVIEKVKSLFCAQRYRRLILQFVDETLPAAAELELKTHLRNCRRCRADVERQAFTAHLVSSYVLPEESPFGKPEWRGPVTAIKNPQRLVRPFVVPVTIAACVLIIAGVAWRYLRTPRVVSWEVVRLTGHPKINQRLITRAAKISPGESIETDGESRAMVQVGTLGQVEIDPNTRIRFLKAEKNNHRLALERGKIYATILAPPRQFFVETPSALAIDLGCSYSLEVNDLGESILRVGSGWVALNLNGREALIPAGAECVTKPGIGPGTPHFEDASEKFKSALAAIDFDGGRDLGTVLSEARPRDGLSLLQLLTRVQEQERAEVYDRLAVLSPPPAEVTRAGILTLNQSMLDAWRERLEYLSIGIDPAKVPVATGTLKPVGNMVDARFGHTATLLTNGKVLIAGGREKEGSILSSAELYDPATQQFITTGPMATKRVGHTATLLLNGKVLITGGSDEEFYAGSLSSAELYDPISGTFSSAGTMGARRLAHRATLLLNGKVLITGGQGEEWANLDSTEIYDPEKGTFKAAAAMNEKRADHTATLLADGRVLVTGGAAGRYNPVNVSATAEIYDALRNSFRLVGSMSVVRYKHSAEVMPDGRVIVIGGSNALMWKGQYASAEFFDPTSGRFAPTGQLNTARYKIRDAVVLLQSGKILVAGGGRAEIFDPATGLFGAVKGGMGTTRYYATATLLPTGEVLIVGGYSAESSGDMPANTSAWIYQP